VGINQFDIEIEVANQCLGGASEVGSAHSGGVSNLVKRMRLTSLPPRSIVGRRAPNRSLTANT
jgi:hypothetical protein